MPLNKTQLKNGLKNLLTQTVEQEGSIDDFADGLAGLVDQYVKTATIFATPADITAAAISNTAGPCAAANNLNCNIT
ncbi:MAG: hypothetical protein ACNA7V_06675 [Bacteroidales bacterium]